MVKDSLEEEGWYVCTKCKQPCSTNPESHWRHSLWEYKSVCCGANVTINEAMKIKWGL